MISVHHTVYEYLKNEHEEEVTERHEEVIDVQYGLKAILEKLQEIREELVLKKKNCRSEKKKGCERSDKNTRGCVCQKWNSLLFTYMELKIK